MLLLCVGKKKDGCHGDCLHEVQCPSSVYVGKLNVIRVPPVLLIGYKDKLHTDKNRDFYGHRTELSTDNKGAKGQILFMIIFNSMYSSCYLNSVPLTLPEKML